MTKYEQGPEVERVVGRLDRTMDAFNLATKALSRRDQKGMQSMMAAVSHGKEMPHPDLVFDMIADMTEHSTDPAEAIALSRAVGLLMHVGLLTLVWTDLRARLDDPPEAQ